MGFRTVSPQTMDHNLTVTSFRSLQRSISLNTLKPPRYLQSNGKAENSGKTAKNILKKAADAGHDHHLSLLDFRRDGQHSCTASLPCPWLIICFSRKLFLMLGSNNNKGNINNLSTTTQELGSCHHAKSEMWCGFDPYHVSQNG